MSNHPAESFLKRYASNHVSARRKTQLVEHLEQCRQCQTDVSRFRQAGRRLREFEREALSICARQMS